MAASRAGLMVATWASQMVSKLVDSKAVVWAETTVSTTAAMMAGL
jgi:hypothetical protein